MDKLGLEKAKEPEIELPNIHWIMEKAREFQENIYFCLIDYTKVFDSKYEPGRLQSMGSQSQT